MKNLLSLLTTLTVCAAFITLAAFTLNKVPKAANNYADYLIELQRGE